MQIARFTVSSPRFSNESAKLPPPVDFEHSCWKVIVEDIEELSPRKSSGANLYSIEDFFGVCFDTPMDGDCSIVEPLPMDTIPMNSDLPPENFHVHKRRKYGRTPPPISSGLTRTPTPCNVELMSVSPHELHANELGTDMRSDKTRKTKGKSSQKSKKGDEKLYGSTTPRGSKRKRKTPKQLAILEREFSKNPMPNKDIRERLGSCLGLTSRQVQIWFQNKRAKERNRGKEKELEKLKTLKELQNLKLRRECDIGFSPQPEIQQDCEVTHFSPDDLSPHLLGIPADYDLTPKSSNVPPVHSC